MFINYIKVPFITFYEVYPYIDSSTLGVIISGNYQSIPSSFESFDEYNAGFNQFFSGSGLWGGSGQVFAPYLYIVDNFSNYQTETNFTGLAATGGVFVSGYTYSTGYQYGYINLSGDFL